MTDPGAERPATSAPSPAPVVRVVDDDPSFLRAVTRRIEAAGFLVEAFGSAEACLAGTSDAPGCAVIDLQLSGRSGLELQAAFAAAADPLPIIFLTGHGDVPTSVRAMKDGAVDFLIKPVSGDDLVDAIRRGIARDAAARAERARRRAWQARLDRLTPRERQVFTMIAGGLLNKQIAARLGTSERTIKAHRARVMHKLEAHSTADLGRLAGLLEGPGPAPGHDPEGAG